MRKWSVMVAAVVMALLLSGCAAAAVGMVAAHRVAPGWGAPYQIGAAPGMVPRPTPTLTTAQAEPTPTQAQTSPPATTTPEATPPSTPQLDSYSVVDDLAGVLTPAQKADIEAAFAETAARTGVHLFIVYVDSFDGRSGVEAADQFAMDKYLTEEDVLLAVAIEDQQYGVSYPMVFEVSDGTAWELAMGELEVAFVALLSQAANAPQGEADWSAAAIAAAYALVDALGSQPAQTT